MCICAYVVLLGGCRGSKARRRTQPRARKIPREQMRARARRPVITYARATHARPPAPSAQYTEAAYGPNNLDWSSRIGGGTAAAGRIKPDMVTSGVGIVAGRSDGDPESGGTYGCRCVRIICGALWFCASLRSVLLMAYQTIRITLPPLASASYPPSPHPPTPPCLLPLRRQVLHIQRC